MAHSVTGGRLTGASTLGGSTSGAGGEGDRFRGGFSVGVSLHHVVADGHSFSWFMNRRRRTGPGRLREGGGAHAGRHLDGARETVVVAVGREGWVAEWEEMEARRVK
ncbi:hypothetical protein QJS10_CPB11g00921 [Acorus calamus]|uniref:Uncharacterized protein n=1 Tax=Acorus calamus TaxID=4465 RepID=A0AAV9DNB1_ACOCL|nr:hypothetical protein QJS10_CPB11g00921 [Acorus calamus]